MFVRYNETGKICEVVQLHDEAFRDWAREHPTLTYLEVDERTAPPLMILTHYVDLKTLTLTERPTIMAPDEVVLSIGESYTIQDLPIPCFVQIDNDEPIEVDTGELTFDGEMVDVYKVTISAWPHLPTTTTVSITP